MRAAAATLLLALAACSPAATNETTTLNEAESTDINATAAKAVGDVDAVAGSDDGDVIGNAEADNMTGMTDATGNAD